MPKASEEFILSDLVQSRLRSLATELARFLEGHLSAVGGPAWWQTHVVGQLTDDQQRRVNAKQIGTLPALDLVALLRVFERNWPELSYKARLPPELRTFAREIGLIRNRLAHPAPQDPTFSADDSYRALDTIERFLTGVGSEPELLAGLRGEKTGLLRAMGSPPNAPAALPSGVTETPATDLPPSAARTSTEVHLAHLRLVRTGEHRVQLRGFDRGGEVTASVVRWTIRGGPDLQLVVDVARYGVEGDAAEVGQVFCSSRMDSPDTWDDIVDRLRVGLYRGERDQWQLELKTVVRQGRPRAQRRVLDLGALQRLTGCDVKAALITAGAGAVGTRRDLFDDAGPTRNRPVAVFAPDNELVPVLAYLATSVLSLVAEEERVVVPDTRAADPREAPHSATIPTPAPARSRPIRPQRALGAPFMKPVTPSKQLAKIVGAAPIPRTEVTMRLWAYIKQNGLQDKSNKMMINADAALKDVCGGKAFVNMFEMTKFVSKHLS